MFMYWWCFAVYYLCIMFTLCVCVLQWYSGRYDSSVLAPPSWRIPHFCPRKLKRLLSTQKNIPQDLSFNTLTSKMWFSFYLPGLISLQEALTATLLALFAWLLLTELHSDWWKCRRTAWLSNPFCMFLLCTA